MPSQAPLAALADRPELTAAVADSRVAVDRLLRHRVLRSRAGEVSAESALRGARGSAALAGVERPLDQVRALTGPPADEADQVLLGALRVAAAIVPLAATWRSAPLQALARLHVLAAADAVPEQELGRPTRSGPRLLALATLAGSAPTTPAVVEAAIVHAELLALEPFAWGNGLVARAAGRLVLAARGLDPTSLAAPEVGHVAARLEYDEAAAGYAEGPDGVLRWVQHCADALVIGAQDSLAVCEALLRG